MAGTPRKAAAKRINVGSNFDKPVEEFEETATVNEDDSNVLADLKEILGQDVDRPPTVLPIPTRRGLSIAFTKDISFDMVNTLQRKAGMKGGDTKRFDQIKFFTGLLANTCEDILVHGRSTGLTFASEQFQQMIGSPLGGVPATVRKTFSADGHLIIAANTVLREAGYNPEDIDVDEVGEEDGPLDS